MKVLLIGLMSTLFMSSVFAYSNSSNSLRNLKFIGEAGSIIRDKMENNDKIISLFATNNLSKIGSAHSDEGTDSTYKLVTAGGCTLDIKVKIEGTDGLHDKRSIEILNASKMCKL